MSARDGGPAFPEIRTETTGERGEYTQEVYSAGGMSLRDYFAAKAISSAITAFSSQFSKPNRHDLAKYAYEVADAMLAAREVQP